MHISLIFFVEQKTAYEMRISDLSSDVCSSDLRPGEIGASDAGLIMPTQPTNPSGDSPPPACVGWVGSTNPASECRNRIRAETSRLRRLGWPHQPSIGVPQSRVGVANQASRVIAQVSIRVRKVVVSGTRWLFIDGLGGR